MIHFSSSKWRLCFLHYLVSGGVRCSEDDDNISATSEQEMLELLHVIMLFLISNNIQRLKKTGTSKCFIFDHYENSWWFIFKSVSQLLQLQCFTFNLSAACHMIYFHYLCPKEKRNSFIDYILERTKLCQFTYSVNDGKLWGLLLMEGPSWRCFHRCSSFWESRPYCDVTEEKEDRSRHLVVKDSIV